jgi:hypothetical protein
MYCQQSTTDGRRINSDLWSRPCINFKWRVSRSDIQISSVRYLIAYLTTACVTELCLWLSHTTLFYKCAALHLHFVGVFTTLNLSLLMSYIYGDPCKARNVNVVYIWTYVWQFWKPSLSICCTMFQHWINAESCPVAQLCVNTLLSTKITLFTDGI